MSASKGTKWIQGQMTPTNATYTTMLLGPVMLAYGSDTLRVTGMLRALAGSFGAKVRYRTFTARVEEPDAWVDSATVRSAAGEFSEDFSLAAIGAKLWIQPALAGATIAGAAGAEAFAAFQGWTKSNGVALATRTFEIDRALGPQSDPDVFSDLEGGDDEGAGKGDGLDMPGHLDPIEDTGDSVGPAVAAGGAVAIDTEVGLLAGLAGAFEAGLLVGLAAVDLSDSPKVRCDIPTYLGSCASTACFDAQNPLGTFIAPDSTKDCYILDSHTSYGSFCIRDVECKDPGVAN